MKIRSMEAELFHADTRMDRRTDITKLIIAFQHFANTLKNCMFLKHINQYILEKNQ